MSPSAGFSLRRTYPAVVSAVVSSRSTTPERWYRVHFETRGRTSSCTPTSDNPDNYSHP